MDVHGREWKKNSKFRDCFCLYLGRPSNHRERPGGVPEERGTTRWYSSED